MIGKLNFQKKNWPLTPMKRGQHLRCAQRDLLLRSTFSMGARGGYEDFVTGFVIPEGKVWVRPAGITVAKDGSVLISEDGDGTIWRVSYRK
jgi:glucose/arabinose dehydrogenase